MTPPTPQGDKQSAEHRPKVRDKKDWPELEPVRSGITPEQAFAKEVVKKQGENAGKLLIARSKALLAVTILAFLSVVLNAFYVVPALLRGDTGVTILLFVSSMVVQLSAAGYFLKAKDPEFAAQVLKLLLILNGLTLLMGFAWITSLPLTLAIIILMFSAYKRMEQLKYGGD